MHTIEFRVKGGKNRPRKIDAVTVQQREMFEYYFVHGGYTISGIADGRNGAPHKVKRRTLSRWIQWYLTWDCPPAHNQKLLNLNNGATYSTTEQLEALRRFVLGNPMFYLDEIRHRLPELELPIVSVTIRMRPKNMLEPQSDREGGQFVDLTRRYWNFSFGKPILRSRLSLIQLLILMVG